MQRNTSRPPVKGVEPVCPIALEYFLLTQNNACAACLLHLFHHQQAEHVSNVLTCTMQQLEVALRYEYPLAEIHRGLAVLLKETFLYLTPDPLGEKRQRGRSKCTSVTLSQVEHDVYTQPKIQEGSKSLLHLLIDRRKISFLLETCIVLSSPERLLAENHALQKKHKRQKSLVEYQCSRAWKEQLPATLTLFHWMQTWDYFDGTCAYCAQEPAYVIEHYLPIGHGGGTQWSNCVPACRKCNGKKGEKHPDQVITIPSLASMGAYLTMIKHIEETLLAHRKRMIIQQKHADHQRLDGMNRALISTVRFNHRIERFFSSLQMIRFCGWLTGGILCFLIPAPWWLASSFYQTHQWSLIFCWTLMLCACLLSSGLAVATLDPHWRHHIETWMALSEHKDETWADELTQIALQSQDEREEMQEELDTLYEYMTSDTAKEMIQERFLEDLGKNWETLFDNE